jgi:hypothetical protein
VRPLELAERVNGIDAPRVHVYGPARMLSGQVDEWWLNKRKPFVQQAPGRRCIRYLFRLR